MDAGNNKRGPPADDSSSGAPPAKVVCGERAPAAAGACEPEKVVDLTEGGTTVVVDLTDVPEDVMSLDEFLRAAGDLVDRKAAEAFYLVLLFSFF